MFARPLMAATLALGLAAPLTVLSAPATLAAEAAVVQEKVVYHVNDSANASANASAALRNIKNHLNTSPAARIVVVTHGQGIDFLLKDAQDDKGNPYQAIVEGLKARGVDFRVCNNTLTARKIDPERVIAKASIVPSGVAEIGKLQAREGFVYLKMTETAANERQFTTKVAGGNGPWPPASCWRWGSASAG
ncbi:MAG: DsrE family protein [Halothiobacillaceae bacterium]